MRLVRDGRADKKRLEDLRLTLKLTSTVSVVGDDAIYFRALWKYSSVCFLCLDRLLFPGKFHEVTSIDVYIVFWVTRVGVGRGEGGVGRRK